MQYNRWIAFKRFLSVKDGRQLFVLHLDQIHGLLGDVLALGSNRRHRIADIQYLIPCQHVFICDTGTKSERTGLFVTHDNDFATRQALGRRSIDGDNSGMVIGAAFHFPVQHPGKNHV